MRQRLAGADGAERGHRDRRHRDRDGQAAPPGHGLAGPAADDDVQRPERGRDEHEHQAGHVERLPAGAVAAGQAQGEHAGDREQDPADIPRAPRQHRRQGQRAEELDRHRGAEGEPGQGGVEEPVGAREAESVEDDDPPLGCGPGAYPRPDQGQHDHRGKPEAQQHRAGGAGDREQPLGQGCPALQGGARPEDEQQGRAGPLGPRRPVRPDGGKGTRAGRGDRGGRGHRGSLFVCMLLGCRALTVSSSSGFRVIMVSKSDQ